MMDLYDALVEAVNIAVRAHAGQRDKTGDPYLGHIFRVMGRAAGIDGMIVAALHDTLEDTNLTTRELHLFPPEVVDAVVAITRRDNEAYEAYIDRVAQNRLAALVKLGDLMDNLDPGRLDRLPDAATRARLEGKYRTALQRLASALAANVRSGEA